MAQFETIRVKKLAEEVGQRIKKSIFDGIFASGDKLPSEHELAVQFGVSQITVRQAVRVLESAGIIYTKQGVEGGLFVAEADTEVVSSYLSDMLQLKRVSQEDLTVSRLLFEPDIATRSAAVWKAGDLDILEQNIQDAQAAFDRDDLNAARIYNLGFHRMLCAITKNPVIIFALNAVIDVLEENVVTLQLSRDFIHQEIAEHGVLLEKVRARDTEGVRMEMQKHIQEVHDALHRQRTVTER